MTTDSDSECSYVANLADFNVMRVIIIVSVIKIVYNSSIYKCLRKVERLDVYRVIQTKNINCTYIQQ